jgi:dihydrolipoamide dehydrogenase
MEYDVAIIGGGPGGYVAALRAAQNGLATCLIEKDAVGGTCLNRGCIPTKTFVAAAEHSAATGARVDMKALLARKNKVVTGLRNGIHSLLKGRKVTTLAGRAEFLSKSELVVHDAKGTKTKVSAKYFIIATGSTWRELKGLRPDGKWVLTSDEMLDIETPPKNLVIVGGGVIGCEFASIMNAFGTEVTIVEALPQLLPMMDGVISRLLSLSFKKRGIKIFTDMTVKQLADGKVALSDGQEIAAEKVLISIGRGPHTEGLGLDKIGLALAKGFVPVEENMRTETENIYAIGDVAVFKNGHPKHMLAHVASHDAMIAIRDIKKRMSKEPLQDKGEALKDYDVIPGPVFTAPEVASVGKTEAELKKDGVSYRAGKFSYIALSKAVCDDETEGLLQVYIGDDKCVLGAHCIGAHATDVIAELALGMRRGLKADDIAEVIHAHPTYSEIVAEALEDAMGHALHKMGALS